MKKDKNIINKEKKIDKVANKFRDEALAKALLPKNKSVFAVICNQTPDLSRAKLFSTVEGAQKHLKFLADERRYRLGVDYLEETLTKLSYTIGWEAHMVIFSIVELSVED